MLAYSQSERQHQSSAIRRNVYESEFHFWFYVALKHIGICPWISGDPGDVLKLWETVLNASGSAGSSDDLNVMWKASATVRSKEHLTWTQSRAEIFIRELRWCQAGDVRERKLCVRLASAHYTHKIQEWDRDSPQKISLSMDTTHMH